MPTKQSTAILITADEFAGTMSSMRGARCMVCQLPAEMLREIAKLREWKMGCARLFRFLEVNGITHITRNQIRHHIYDNHNANQR